MPVNKFDPPYGTLVERPVSGEPVHWFSIMMKSSVRTIVMAAWGGSLAAASAAELHVSPTGNDAGSGSGADPLRTISAAAERAVAGDIITVHAGVYREWVAPPRGGESDAKRITYQAAKGEKVVITGSEAFTTWRHVSGEVWRLVLPSSYFGGFNPYAEEIHGDWFHPKGLVHRRGCVYLNNTSLAEVRSLDELMDEKRNEPAWFSLVDGLDQGQGKYLVNVVSLQPQKGAKVEAVKTSRRHDVRDAPCAEGGQCVGYVTHGSWVVYPRVDFGEGSAAVELRAAAQNGTGGFIELREGSREGRLLGTCEVPATGGWQEWRNFTARIVPVRGMKDLCLVFQSLEAHKRKNTPPGEEKTTLYARLPGTDPNNGAVEISVRPTVFTPQKTGVNHITVRGFEMRNAATNWAPPTMGQRGLLTAYWCKGWIIEDNEIHNSRCGGIILGKYADEHDGSRGTAEGYLLTIEDALQTGGWSKENVGGHVVRNNHVHHCGQAGIAGGMGCAFSRIEGNEIHHIACGIPWSGAEMAGIKFHAAIDTVITGNHVHHNGDMGGLWLDWMAQGTQVTNNLFHDNAGYDLFTEVNHGPFLIANNLFLSPAPYLSNSQGGAFVHNLIAGPLKIVADGRRTPFMEPHGTRIVGTHDCPVGDMRWFNNLFCGRAGLTGYDSATLPVAVAGNLFTKDATPGKTGGGAARDEGFDPQHRLTRRGGEWFLTLRTREQWREAAGGQLITGRQLGKAEIPGLPFENPDGSEVRVDTDYFGRKRPADKPFPGPFEVPAAGEIKVWPRP